MNDNAKSTAGDRGGSDSHGGSNALFACLTLITYFVPWLTCGMLQRTIFQPS